MKLEAICVTFGVKFCKIVLIVVDGSVTVVENVDKKALDKLNKSVWP